MLIKVGDNGYKYLLRDLFLHISLQYNLYGRVVFISVPHSRHCFIKQV